MIGHAAGETDDHPGGEIHSDHVAPGHVPEPQRRLLGGGPANPDVARLLFRYVGVEEWQDYRAIMAVLAGTFFAEFSPDDVQGSLAASGLDLDAATVGARLESLRNWGNVSVSTSVGNPSSLEDYYRRRHRYLVTRHGQEVHEIVEGILSRVDDVADVQAGRLRDLHRALLALQGLVDRGSGTATADEIGDAVRAVFDPHRAFSTEITQFFAAINQWQSRYDLDADEVQFFADVVVGYVSEQLAEIERMSRPIAVAVRQLGPHLDAVVAGVDGGLAERVDAAGLGASVSVRRSPGALLADWEHLGEWFSAPPGGRSRLDALTRQALAAVSTLTKNLTRLSRTGVGSVSRRADFVRLAGWLDAAGDVDDAHDLVAASFGLFPSRHFGALASDADDPVASTVSWEAPDGPRAVVPVALRERGEVTARGRPSPIRDRSIERDQLRFLRQVEAEGRARAAAEILEAADLRGVINDVELTEPAFDRLRDLVAQAASKRVGIARDRRTDDDSIAVTVTRDVGMVTTLRGPHGVLRMFDTSIVVSRSAEPGEPMMLSPQVEREW